MNEEVTIYIEEVQVRENTVDALEAKFLRTNRELWLTHVDIDGAVHALVYPSVPVVRTPVVNLKLAARFFRDLTDFQRILGEICEEIFEGPVLLTDNYQVTVNAPLHKSPYSRNGKPMNHTEGMSKFREFNSMESRAVTIPILELLSRLKPPQK